MIVRAIKNNGQKETLENSGSIIIKTDSGVPVVVIGQDHTTGGIWLIDKQAENFKAIVESIDREKAAK